MKRKRKGKGQDRIVRKRCQRCGHVVKVRASTMHCVLPRFGVNSYACHGKLERISPRRRKVVRAVPDPGAAYRRKVRGLFATRQRRAARWLRAWQRKLRTAERQVARWEAKAAAADRKVAMTDQDIDAVRQRALQAAHVQQVRRRLLAAAGQPDNGKLQLRRRLST